MPTITVQGTITDQSGSPVVGMTVHLMTEFSVIVDTTATDGSGFYSVSEFRASGGGARVRSNPTALSPHYTDPGAGPLHLFPGISTTYTDNFQAQRVNANPTRGTVGTQNFDENSGTHTVDRTMGDPDGDSVNPVKDTGPAWGGLGAVSATTYRWSFDTDGVAPGNYSFSYHIEDPYGGSSSVETFTVTIAPAGNAPTITNPGLKSYFHNSGNQTFSLEIDDPDPGDTLTVTKITGPAWGTTNAFGEVTFNTNVAPRGEHTFKWRVTDEAGNFAEATHTVEILNNPPVLTNPGTKTFKRGSGNQTFQLVATDADSDPITFTKLGGVALTWATVTTGGLVTVDTNTPAFGNYSLTWEAEDSENDTDAEGHTIAIVAGSETPFFQVI